ncbi:MAG TPA: UDP-N-acetylmuramoyl-L-alanyl-D-glutamate--2,6-diaminopimelate ligase [Desulfobacteria bacterium]|nr:UDP-N-acetylmuramoyl-L-alanyl-D-glutamate--2,6-diaminopimelate ligase [Desulfobacteria bacterium]
MRTLGDLIRDIQVTEKSGDLSADIKGIAYDSRKVEPGFVFVCVQGFKSDGHNFVDAALEKKAAAIVAQKPVRVPEGIPLILTPDTRKALALMGGAFADYPSRKLIMIGITGTNGKTTTTYLAEQILKEHGGKVGLIGTIMNKIGDRVFPVKNTTPESLDLQLLLKEMADEKVTHVVMEVSSHALELDRVAGVEFDTAVFTNITQDHLDFHETMENYLAAKTKLFSNLNNSAVKKKEKYSIINVDDPSSDSVIRAAAGKILTYGINKKCDVKASNINLKANGVSFDVRTPEFELFLELRLTGLFNVYNALAALSVGLAEGVSPADIKNALESVKGVPGRLEPVDEGQAFTVLVDYAHTPDGLENIIKAAREFTGGRVITLFGCGGDRDRTKRPIMGEISGRLSDYSILTSDNPRTEEPLFILSQIEGGVSRVADRTRYSVIPDRREAIGYAVKMAQPGDVVLVAGKGHETYQIVGDKVNHFDDREEVSNALRALKQGAL